MANDWFSYYFGYNRKLKKTFFYMKFADGTEISNTEENVNHVRSKNNFLWLGKDKFDFYTTWDGRFQCSNFARKGRKAWADTPEAIAALIDAQCQAG